MLITAKSSGITVTDAEGTTPFKQPKLDFTGTAVQLISQAELNKLIARYVVHDMPIK